MTREEAISKLNELIECTVDRAMIDEICYEIIEFLESQVPRVMTVEEAKEYLSGGDEERIPLYVEFYFKCPLWIKWTNENLMQNIKGITAWEFNEYNTQCEFGWRVWTIKPSPELMASTPWEGEAEW